MPNTVIREYNAYMNDYMKRCWKRRRENAVKLLGGKCVVCGKTEELEFDHIEPKTKLMSIAKMSGLSEQRFQEELKKCQLLCHKHHVEKTNRQTYK